eukprot:1415504-Pyramimonas_sp.AAC.1
MTIHWGLLQVKFSEGSEKFCTPWGYRLSWVGTGTLLQKHFRRWAGIRNFVVASSVLIRTPGLAANVLSCEISRKASVKPHWPVVVKFKGRPLDEKINILRLPRLFPTELVVGPRCQPRDYGGLLQE